MKYESNTDFKGETITIDGVTYSVDMATVLSADKGITSFQLIRGVRRIGEYAFAGCQNLRVVRIPETVIRIEDFAFRDCFALHEVHLPYYMEYISSLAFTYSEGDINRFYMYPLKVFIPKKAFLRYAYMIPQYISEYDYEEYGLTDNDMAEVEGWNTDEGLPISVNEDELYRIAIKDYLQYRYMIGDYECTDEPHDIQQIYNSVFHYIFNNGLCDFLNESELIETDDEHIINNIDDSFGALMEHRIRERYKLSQNYRPIELIYDTLGDALQLGFVTVSTEKIKSNAHEFYGDMLFKYLQHCYGNAVCGYYCQIVENDSALKELYDKMDIDTEKVLNCFILRYNENGLPINVKSLKRIIRQTMKILFHIGYSYGISK